MNKKPAVPAFEEGDSVVLAEGTHQGTSGIFLHFREDANWADITERDGSVWSHPVAWLAYSVEAVKI
jgi:hypothetical protein